MDVRVELRRGGLEAVVVLGPDRGDSLTLAQAVREELGRLGVQALPSETDLQQRLVVAPPGVAEILVAEGVSPQPGISAQLVAFFPRRDTPVEDGVDVFAAYGANVTYPDTDVLRKTPASEGISGRTLLGTPVPAAHGQDIPIVPGDGVSESEDGLLFRSKTYGVVLFHHRRLRVVPALQVADDRMQALLTVLPDPRHEEEVHRDRILKALADLGVTHGIDYDALAEAVRRVRESGQPVPWIVAARGQLPVDGQEPDYHLVVDLDKKAGTLVDGDRIDFKEMETVKNVCRGDVLAEALPFQEPVPGFRVDGAPLAPKVHRAQGLKPGERTVLSEDGTRVLSDADGMVVLRGGKFHVEDEYLVPADVDFSTGNIRASGSVRVRGQVTPGFVVQAGKGIEIAGDVWEGVVNAGGEIKVRGAITAGSRVTAGGTISARFILNSRVETEGDVEVALSVTGSEIYAKGRLRVVGTQGVILGGEVNAALGIEARTIGSAGSRTRVAVGVDLRIARELEEVSRTLPTVQDELRKLQGSLSREFLRDPRAALLSLPPALRKPKIEILQRMKDLQQRAQELAARRDELTRALNEAREAHIAVHGEIHAGTVVTIGPAKTTLTETVSHVLLRYDPEHNGVVWRRL
ncbi:MAG: DUF342 domain-containing protein [Deltaproteobacteria bacterium]|nr:DUF342 domain-containing protein [Deltaproteobacteria bacterium]